MEILNLLGDFGYFSKKIDFARFPRKWKQRAHYDQRYDHSDGWGILQFISYQNLLEEVDGHCLWLMVPSIYESPEMHSNCYYADAGVTSCAVYIHLCMHPCYSLVYTFITIIAMAYIHY